MTTAEKESNRILYARLELDSMAQSLYRTWAIACGNPEPWHNIMPPVMEAWREIARIFLNGECGDCREQMACPQCAETIEGWRRR